MYDGRMGEKKDARVEDDAPKRKEEKNKADEDGREEKNRREMCGNEGIEPVK